MKFDKLPHTMSDINDLFNGVADLSAVTFTHENEVNESKFGSSHTLNQKHVLSHHFKQAHHAWKRIMGRMRIYDKLDSIGKEQYAHNTTHEKMRSLYHSNRLTYLLKKIALPLKALEEHRDFSPDECYDNKLLLIQHLLTSLAKIELMQLEILNEAQLGRKNDAEKCNLIMQDYKHNFMKQIYAVSFIHYNEHTHAHASYFFKKYTSKIHFKKNFEMGEKAGMVAFLISTTIRFGIRITDVVTLASTLVTTIISRLTAPMYWVSLVLSNTVQLISNIIKPAIKQYDKKAIGMAILILTTSLACSVLIGLFPPLAAYAMYVLAAISLGTLTVSNILPNFKKVTEYFRSHKTIKDCVSLSISAVHYPLDPIYKQLLLLKLEKLCELLPSDEKTAVLLSNSRNAILSGEATIANDPLIKKMIEESGNKEFSAFLKNSLKPHQIRLEEDIQHTKKQIFMGSISTVVGAIELAGMICFLIPTPVTYLVGSGLFLLCAIHATLSKFHLIDRLANALFDINHTIKTTKKSSTAISFHALNNASNISSLLITKPLSPNIALFYPSKHSITPKPIGSLKPTVIESELPPTSFLPNGLSIK